MDKNIQKEIKIAVIGALLTHGNQVKMQIEGLPKWIEKQTERMNDWEVAPYLINNQICSNVVIDIAEKFDEILDIFKNTVVHDYFSREINFLFKDLEAELLMLEKKYPDRMNTTIFYSPATYPFLAKFIYGYKNLAQQINYAINF